MKKKMAVFIALFLFPMLASGAEYAKILSVDSIQVIKIAPQDKRAIIKTSDGIMRIIQAGETLQAENKTASIPGLRVDDISTDRIVIQEKKANGTSTVNIILQNGNQRIERVK
jgi:hypothetical protein